LIESGDYMGAVRVVKRLYAYDTTTARRFVQELAEKKTGM
jgi:hypothetical protein